MQGNVRVDLLQKSFKPINQLPVPGHERRPAMDVSRLMDLVLLDPFGNAVWIEIIIKLDNRITKMVSLFH